MEPYKPEPEFQRFYHRLLRPLSLFPRTTTRTESQKRLPQEVPMLLPLPVSGLTVASLCRQVAERLANSGLEARAPRKVRLRFTEVILDELKCSWQEPPTEPGLSHLNNQRLRKRLLVYVLLSSEQLFVRYLHLQKIMSTPAAVFTESATLTRLAASLARDCTVFLTGPKVYRGLLADFRALLKEGQVQVCVPRSKPELEGDTVAEDLKQRMKNMHLEWSHYSLLDSGLPPLLGALTYCPAAKHHMEELQRMLKGLEEKEASEQWSLQSPRSPPLEPQPVTVTLKLRNQVVQAAAVQVSARNFLDSFHVEGAGVLYNHLAGELEPKLIEEMDTDRTFGSSIGEVYKELMSCVSNDHFSFDQGPLVEPAANEDWSAFLSSAFLRQEKQRRIINTKLAGLYSQRANTLQSNPDKMSSLTSLQASKSWEKWSNKASWLNWWKTTLSVGDYFKYLTTQQTDFLHVIFQMYEEEVPVEIVAPVRESLKIQHPPPLLENNEPDFVPGEWDWDTVLEYRLGTKNNSLLEDSHKILSLQKRLERLWSMLEVPDKDRLDMAIKYSSNARLRQLPSLVSAWERALQPIQLREILLGRLECFERQASDPNRFFHKTDMGLSRFLEENQIRSHLHKRLSLVEAPLVPLLEEIELVFGEPVTFKGRRYLDKMKHDKVEMLYWLQQRRRVRHLVRAKRASHQSALSRKLSSQPLVAPGNTPLLFDQTKCPQIPPSPPYTQQLTQTS
ncbi:hypothetical protein E2I00_007644 [Balaenoptera physalus]|uniref:Coiled-coil domain-containing protein 87 n=1 Tax=Balaenoptera physalus TaxID=9770 RepID=A0A6A1QP37_BALPH|nr:hypothetical protein E2I00_007644 [Balaenoptera physalus]